MSDEGSIPAAAACVAWERPISRLPGVTNALFDMFWALKGATAIPLRMKIRQMAVTMELLPTDDPVPWTINVLAGAGVALNTRRLFGLGLPAP